MELRIFCVYDSKAAAYLQPFFMNTRGQAVRAIMDCLHDVNHQFRRHPADFSLWELGSFFDHDAKVAVHDSPVPLGTCLELLSVMLKDAEQLPLLEQKGDSSNV